MVLKDPNASTHKLAYHEDAELLLSASDDAFNKKFGIDNDKELPSEIGAGYNDYNFNDSEPKGKPCQPEELRLQYKALYELYHTFSDN